jgi:hypothetical protein
MAREPEAPSGSHAATDQERTETTEASTGGSALGRRTYLQLGVAATAAGLAGRATAATSRHGISFDRTVDLVDDLGADPSGSRRIDDALSSVDEGTLVEVPAGTYQLGGRFTVTEDRVGFVGTGDARFRLPSGFNGPFIHCDGPDQFLFEGIDVDMRGDRSGHMRLHCRTRFHVEDVEYLGRGTDTGYAFNVAVKSSSGTGRLRDVVVKKGHRIEDYNSGNGRIGVWAGWRHKGTLRVESCDFREFGNNALYTSRCEGPVQVVDSYFENNSPASIRISGDGSYAENCTVRLDLGQYTGPSIGQRFNARGIVIEQKKASDVPLKPAGAYVEGCTLEYLDTGDWQPTLQGVIDVWGGSRTLTVRDTDIRVDLPNVPAVRREHPKARNPHRPDLQYMPEPHWVRLDDVTITGAARGNAAVDITEADGCEVRDCCIRQWGPNRAGVQFSNAADGVVADTNISVTGTAVATEGSAVRTGNLSTSESCGTDASGRIERRRRPDGHPTRRRNA